MYPRNAASPPRIAIGAVVQISDGAVQTAGVTVRVIEQGGVEGDGGGTTTYSTDGIVIYTPTQAETDQIAFIVIAKKTGCIPVAQTIITSASDVTGYAGVDWSKVNAPTSTVGLTNTTVGIVTTATNVTTVNGIAANVITAGSIADGAIDAATFAAGAINAAAIATGAIDADALAADAANEIADAILDRDMSTGVDSGSTTVRTARQALRLLRNKWTASAGTLTVFKEDDSTSSWTGTLTTDVAAVPIIGNNPAGGA